MFKKVKRVLPMALAGVFAVSSAAWASTSVAVTGGTILVASSTDSTAFTTGNPAAQLISGIDFQNLGTIDVSKSLSPRDATDYVFVADNTGKNAGWSVKVSATPLTAIVPDSTANGDVTIAIPTEKVLTAAVSNATALFNSKSHVQAPSGAFSVGASATNILSANKGAGAGAYLAKVNYTLSLPNYLPDATTVTPASDTSAFKDANVTELGLFAGTYTTTLTYSLSAAP